LEDPAEHGSFPLSPRPRTGRRRTVSVSPGRELCDAALYLPQSLNVTSQRSPLYRVSLPISIVFQKIFVKSAKNFVSLTEKSLDLLLR
jgi:hypothetical protein